MQGAHHTEFDNPTDGHVTELPGGRIEVVRGRIGVRYAVKDAADRGRLCASFDRLRGRRADSLLVPLVTAESGTSVNAECSVQDGTLRPFLTLVATWRANPAEYLAVTLYLADIVTAAARAFGADEIRTFLSPCQLFVHEQPGGRARWLLVPLPAHPVPLSTWSESNEESWAWACPEDVLARKGPTSDPIHLAGAVIRHALTELYPDHLSRPRRFSRFLSGRAGMTSVLRSVLEQSVPRRVRSQAAALADFVIRATGPRACRAASPRDMQTQLDSIASEFSAARLVARWEAEGLVTRARWVAERFADYADPADVPWEALERVRRACGDHERASEAVSHLPPPPEPARDRVARWAQGLADQKEAEAMRNEIAERFASPGAMTDQERLAAAIVVSRALGDRPLAGKLLAAPFTVLLDRVLAELTRARPLLEEGDWPQVSSCCRTARKLVSSLPGPPSLFGESSCALADLYDSVAYAEAIRAGLLRNDRLEEAVSLAAASHKRALAAGPADLIEAATTWRAELQRRLVQPPPTIQLDDWTPKALPWPSERWLVG